MNVAIGKIMDAMRTDLLSVARHAMAQPQLGLKGSNLLRTMQIEVSQQQGNIVIETILDDYVSFLEHGRKPMQGKQPPIDKLRDWALTKGLPADNSTLFAISRSIWLHGQQARPIVATIQEQINKRVDDVWMDKLMESMTSELMKHFD